MADGAEASYDFIFKNDRLTLDSGGFTFCWERFF
jgi:hypothetical protein